MDTKSYTMTLIEFTQHFYTQLLLPWLAEMQAKLSYIINEEDFGLTIVMIVSASILLKWTMDAVLQYVGYRRKRFVEENFQPGIFFEDEQQLTEVVLVNTRLHYQNLFKQPILMFGFDTYGRLASIRVAGDVRTLDGFKNFQRQLSAGRPQKNEMTASASVAPPPIPQYGVSSLA